MFITLLIGSAIVGTTWAFHILPISDSVRVVILGVILLIAAGLARNT